LAAAQVLQQTPATGAAACTDPSRVDPLAPEAPLLAASPQGEISSSNGFRKSVALGAVQAHQSAFQAIADANGGTRVSVGAGYAASVAYVQQQMLTAGYQVTVQQFAVDFEGDNTAPVFAVSTPFAATYVNRVDFTMNYSGNGDVTASVEPVDAGIPITAGTSTSGCEAADFAGFPAGAIALMVRGTCTFEEKVANAAAAGASAAIIFNDGFQGRTDAVFGTLSPPQNSIPTIGASFALGLLLATTPGVTARVRVDFIAAALPSYNVIAESPQGNAADVVVVGSPLDSDAGSPGINASSGSAVLLDVARAYAGENKPRNRMRFIWFGANKQGGSGRRHTCRRSRRPTWDAFVPWCSSSASALPTSGASCSMATTRRSHPAAGSSPARRDPGRSSASSPLTSPA
jgi:Zn-dependent M28 family amino/carboxypeptidase